MKASRRDFLTGLTTTTATGLLLNQKNLAQSKEPKHLDKISIKQDGTYETVPLSKNSITLGVVQSRVRSFEAANAKQGIKDNLAHFLDLIDKAFYYGSRPDILFFHEFPVTGWRKWSRKEILTFALELPGEETEQISKKAREYGCYIVFGTYAKDKDWVGHVLSVTTIIDPKGEIVGKHWKARNIKGVFPGFELFTTTIYDVLDKYIEMYGVDEVMPVTRTPYGNIATSSTQNEPEIIRAMAMKGAEIVLRTASGGFNPLDVQASAMYNNVYVGLANNAFSPDNPGFFDDAGSGGSVIYGPDGKAIASTETKFETMITARIPIASFRETHRQPIVHSELYTSVYNQYRSSYPPNLFAAYQPESLEDSKRYLNGKTRWKQK
jgi:predicted amidohydrolase